jgi:hypothetical protein
MRNSNSFAADGSKQRRQQKLPKKARSTEWDLTDSISRLSSRPLPNQGDPNDLKANQSNPINPVHE